MEMMSFPADYQPPTMSWWTVDPTRRKAHRGRSIVGPKRPQSQQLSVLQKTVGELVQFIISLCLNYASGWDDEIGRKYVDGMAGRRPLIHFSPPEVAPKEEDSTVQGPIPYYPAVQTESEDDLEVLYDPFIQPVVAAAATDDHPPMMTKKFYWVRSPPGAYRSG